MMQKLTKEQFVKLCMMEQKKKRKEDKEYKEYQYYKRSNYKKIMKSYLGSKSRNKKKLAG